MLTLEDTAPLRLYDLIADEAVLSVNPAERLLRTWRVGTGRPPEAHLWASRLTVTF